MISRGSFSIVMLARLIHERALCVVRSPSPCPLPLDGGEGCISGSLSLVRERIGVRVPAVGSRIIRAGEIRGAQPLAGVEDFHAHDVTVLVHVHGDPLLNSMLSSGWASRIWM